MGGTMENPYAGQGPVLLDIGGDVGALVVVMPPETDGLEVELRPAGATAAGPTAQGHLHTDGHDHHREHHEHGHYLEHDHDHAGTSGHAASPAHAAYPHVGVVARPDGDGVVHSLVYPSVTEGEYELYPLPDGPVVMTASVIGGQVTRNRWPG
ncbi:hypothetical protein [Pedococcus sp. P5_B7]